MQVALSSGQSTEILSEMQEVARQRRSSLRFVEIEPGHRFLHPWRWTDVTRLPFSATPGDARHEI